MSIDIQLSAFEGPLDLLLHLIAKEEIDIYNIPIISITTQYMAYIDGMKTYDLDMTSEFTVMAATLIEIKSKMLLPERDFESNELDRWNKDPRVELIKRLVEYKKFKEAATELKEREGIIGEIVFKEQEEISNYLVNAEDYNNAETLDETLLLEAVRRLIQKMNRFDEVRQTFFNRIKRDQFTVDDKLELIENRLKIDEFVVFTDLFEGNTSKEEVIVTFLAILELLKQNKINVRQSELFDEIVIGKRFEVVHG